MKNNKKISKYFLLPGPKQYLPGAEIVNFVSPLVIYTQQTFIQTAFQLLNDLQESYNCQAVVQQISTLAFDRPGVYLAPPSAIDAIRFANPGMQIPDFTEYMAEEGYILVSGQNKIIVVANTSAGMFYGITSLLFLLTRQDQVFIAPEIMIRDWPDMRWRGFSDDISRGQVSTLEHFKRIIRFLAHYKMNVYMPYLEDMFLFKNFSSIGQNRGALSADECLELQEYASLYHIEIIPVFQTLGHYENLLIQPEFMPLADFPGASSLNTVSENTCHFLDTLLAEIVPVFRSVYFHIGADESYDVGSGASRAMAESKGIAAVHAAHYARVFNILKKYHKKIIMYGDIILEFPDILQHLPDDIIIMDWHYDIQQQYISTRQFKESGHNFIVSPGNQNWSRIFPDLERARQNIYNLTRDGHNNGAIGAITSSWGDFGSANPRELNYYQIAYAAQCAWHNSPVAQDAFDAVFFKDFYGNDDPGYAALYSNLSQVCEYYDLNYFYSQPFYPLSRPVEEIINRSCKLTELCNETRQELQRLRSITNRNREHLDLLELSARQYEWTARLNRVQAALHNGSAQECAGFAAELAALKQDLDTIANTFRTLWLKYNKSANLENILTLFNRTRAWLDVKRDEVISGNYQLNGCLTAPFITCPAESGAGLPELYIRKKFTISNTLQPVWLQIIADSLATVWVNGRLVGQAIATRTLSAIVEAQRVKLWDIAGHITAGENLLAIKVINYKPGGIAAVNVILESQDRHLQIDGNDCWLCENRVKENWHLPHYQDDHWQAAIPAANAWIISRPEFRYGLSSRVEFYRTPIY